MAMFRNKADRIIDSAHCRIGSAKMMLAHNYTDEQKQAAHDELFAAQRFLRRACQTKRVWYAADHDDNTVMLWCAREEHGYETQGWATFDQWKAKGATVRKGEKATHIVRRRAVLHAPRTGGERRKLPD
jgi:hypothetical protein